MLPLFVMNCVSCQAALAPRSTHCFFCGAAQPSAGPGGAAPGWQAGQGPTTYAQWVASSAPNGEGWRLWASFFLGGLYGPIASRYLYDREEWNAGVRQSNAPPVAPSTRGLVVLGMFFGLPLLCILVLGFAISAGKVIWYVQEGVGYGLSEAHAFAYLNLFVALFYAGSALAAFHVERRFLILLYELTAGDKATIAVFRAGGVKRIVATFLATVPLLLVLYADGVMLAADWSYSVQDVSLAYLLAVAIATWSTSWLHVHPLARFRRAMLSRP